MGATLQQDLAINFLAALKSIWSEHSGTYEVDEETEDLLRISFPRLLRLLCAGLRPWRVNSWKETGKI